MVSCVLTSTRQPYLLSNGNQDERDGQYASAMRKAMTYLEASGGHGLVAEV
jgi:hypothetical protein